LIGDAKSPPTLLASASFDGMAVIGAVLHVYDDCNLTHLSYLDADPYIPNGGGAQWYVNQNNL
jgi:hypothetical protein